MSNARRQSNDTVDGKQPGILVTYLKDIKAPNTGGGAAVTGSYLTRTLNTQEGDATFCVLSSNQFTLIPGTYEIFARVPFGMNNGSDAQLTKVRLRNVTDSATTLPGDSGRFGDGDVSLIASGFLMIMGIFTITSSKTFEIQYQCSAAGATGLGIPSNFTENEVYTQVRLMKLG